MTLWQQHLWMAPYQLSSWKIGCNTISKCVAPSRDNSTCLALPSHYLLNSHRELSCVPTASALDTPLNFASHLVVKWKVFSCRMQLIASMSFVTTCVSM